MRILNLLLVHSTGSKKKKKNQLETNRMAVHSASMFCFMDLTLGSPWESDKRMHEMSSSNSEIFHLGSEATMWQLIVQSQHVRREETVSVWHEKNQIPPWSNQQSSRKPWGHPVTPDWSVSMVTAGRRTAEVLWGLMKVTLTPPHRS